MNEVYLSLGSNVADRLQYLKNACRHISEISSGEVIYSNIYETSAWGFESSEFLNMVIKTETELEAYVLLHELQKIEKILGRISKTIDIYQSRTIDIDILYFNNEIITSPYLIIPHKLLNMRMFVLKPLNDIDPNFRHPGLGKTTCDLIKECTDTSSVHLFCEFKGI